MRTTTFAACIGALLLLVPGFAHAAPRDEVMAGAFHCAGIGDSHVWLDCYYGAAQPVRTQLGLPPAPDYQQHLAATPPGGGAPLDSEVRDAVMDGAFRCGRALGRAWLDCYYAAAQPMRARLGLAPGPQVKPAPSGPALTSVAPMPVPASAPAADRMLDCSFDGDGIFTVKLANGQVWRQISGDTARAHWRKPFGRYQVTIRAGAFGSFNLQVRDQPGLFKVVRIS